MRSAAAADAAVLLVADIDRGGAFAHLVGTWSLLDDDERRRIAGFILNKFRGDASLLPPAPALVEELTGVPTIGVVPWLRHRLPDEDGAFVTNAPASGRIVSVVRYPTSSKLDEMKLLEQVAHVRWATRAADLDEADLVLLPGSKHVAADLAWLRAAGLADAIERSEVPVIGICGGHQMLGGELRDEAGIDEDAWGLGLLPVRMIFRASKRVGRVRVGFGELGGPWAALSGLSFDGYEIRHGETTGGDVVAAGRVLGVAVHGMFESAAVLHALFGAVPAVGLEALFDELADAVEPHLDLERVLA